MEKYALHIALALSFAFALFRYNGTRIAGGAPFVLRHDFTLMLLLLTSAMALVRQYSVAVIVPTDPVVEGTVEERMRKLADELVKDVQMGYFEQMEDRSRATANELWEDEFVEERSLKDLRALRNAVDLYGADRIKLSTESIL